MLKIHLVSKQRGKMEKALFRTPHSQRPQFGKKVPSAYVVKGGGLRVVVVDVVVDVVVVSMLHP